MAQQPTRRPRRPTRATGGRPPIQGTGGQPKPRPSRVDRGLVRDRAIGAVRNSLTDRGIDSNLALHLARVLLSRPGVKLRPGGKIDYHGTRFTPEDFAKTPLARLATGETAKARNEAAITGDPGFLQAQANLQLARDQATAGLDDQRRQALIQFGDPLFAGADATTAGAAAANPFGTSQLLARQFAMDKLAAANAANRTGTFEGGGLQSGLDQAQRSYASQNQDATTQLESLLASLDQQRGLANQGYTVGLNQAKLDAYNSLLASGAIHAATPPNWTVGRFRYTFPNRPRRPRAGGGGAGQFGRNRGQGLPPGTVYPTQYPTGGPVQYNPQLPQAPGGVPPTRAPLPTPVQYPVPTLDDSLRRYGVAV